MEQGIERALAYHRRDRDPQFRDDWESARQDWLDSVEYDSLGDRAMTEPGMPGVIAALAILKAYRPQYRETVQAAPSQQAPALTQINLILGTAEGRKLAERLSLQLSAGAGARTYEAPGAPNTDATEGVSVAGTQEQG